jgi:hypothetical protein
MTDQPHNRFDHTIQLLDYAISLFLEGQFIPALRLAGAAEEILSKALSDSGKENFLDWKYKELEPFHTTLYRTPLSKEDFIRDENLAPDIASASDPSVTLDAKDAAYSMIVRACDNYDRLGLPLTARMHDIYNYFYEHVVGY